MKLAARALPAVTALMLIVSACKSPIGRQSQLSGPSAKDGGVISANGATPASTSVPCAAKSVKAAEPSKPTAKELRIFSLLDDSHLAEAKALIESDPKTVNVEDDDGVTALAVIANEQDETINVGYGLQGTISDNAIGARVPLVADLLIAKGADVNAVDKRGGTPLIWAINGDKPGLAKLLIRNCADVNFTLSARGEEGMTPLHFAAGHGDIDITRDLISSGAKIDVKNKNGETPLFNAAQYGHYLVVDLLLQKGASAGTRDASGRSPLKAAEDNGIDSFRRDRLAAVLQGKGTTK